MELYLIRHAQSQNNALPEHDRVEDPALTEIGHRQGKLLAEWSPSLDLTHIVTSPFLRALQTADHLAGATGLTPEVCTELHEVGGCVRGPWPHLYVGRPGMSREEIQRGFPQFEIPAEMNGEGWWGSKPFESIAEARARAARLLGQTIARFCTTEHRVAYVTHGDFKRVFLEQFHAEPLDVCRNTGVTRISVHATACRLDDYDRVEHIPSDIHTW